MTVQTARALGISVKRLEGWRPITRTTYRYDGHGRLTESTTTTESEWDEAQQDLMLAMTLWEADQCPGCGDQLHVTTAADADDQYIPDPPTRCHKCTALAIGAERAKDSPHNRALLFTAHRR